MPISTSLAAPPYGDDYSRVKQYYEVLFKPGVSVQARELNVVQAMFQNQIEQFGLNIFSPGTVVSGCNFQYYNPYPYIKINDLDAFNDPVITSNLVGYNVRNDTTGLFATVFNFADGFQTTDPDLKTIYLRYNSVGTTGANTLTFTAGDTLTVYDPVMNGIEQININNGGISFSNNNLVVVVPVILCTLNSGSAPGAGSYLNNGNGIANAQVISATSLGSNQYAITLAPRAVDLANTQANSQWWTFNVGDSLTNPAASLTMTLNSIIGTGLQANVVTNGVGTVINVPIFQKGVGYTYDPYITIQSPSNVTGYTTLNLAAQNFLTQIVVASTANAVGNGYAFGVSQGVIFQKGIFLDVFPQQVLIAKYNQLPDNVAVGFISTESIVDYNDDQSLLDNAQGYSNFQAPGADRLQLIPQLQVQTSLQYVGNNQFLPIVQWKEGQPYIQNQQTIYSIIGNEMAQRTEDASGDFVIDPFVVTSRSPLFTNQEGQFFNLVIDPGTAYINGFKVQTVADFNLNDLKGVDTTIVNNHSISLNYGNYLFINQVAGIFPFNTGDTVKLYDTAKTFYNSLGATLVPSGNQIGTANMRSMKLWQGVPGHGVTQYQLYLFNVKMNAGFNFGDTKAVAYGTNQGIADVILQPTAANTNIAALQRIDQDQLVFYSGVPDLKNANQVSYTYRTANAALAVANGNASNATLTIDISATSETFPYGPGILSSAQMQDFYVVPTGGDLLYTAALGGTVNISSGANSTVGTGTGFFTNLVAGDYVYISGNTVEGHSLKQVTSISNNTYLTFDSNPSFTNASAVLIRAFPQYMPINFGFRAGLTANVNTNQNILTLSFGGAFTFSGSCTAFGQFNVQRSNNPIQTNKTANRNVYVSLCTSNNAGHGGGPWCLGVPDVFRLRAVYVGNSLVTNTSTNYVSNFYVDPNQNADFYGLSFLHLQQGSSLVLSANNYLLVKFDYFSSAGGGYYDTVSYLQTSSANQIFLQDSLPLDPPLTGNTWSLTSNGYVNTFEVPEVFADDGTEIDLLSCIDFRPYATATSTPSNISTGLPQLNPSNTITLSTSGEKKFPLPDSNFVSNIEGWVGRVDSLFLDQNGKFVITLGTANTNIALARPPEQPIGVMKVADIVVPHYPNLPINLGPNMTQILQTNIVNNQRFKTTRIANQTISNLAANSAVPFNQPSVYTMAEIGNMDRRLKQVEYYVQLNTLESNATALQIPSSLNPAQTRVAYGVFTDDFVTSGFSAINDPEYEAIKWVDGNITPTRMVWDLQLLGSGSLAYVETTTTQIVNTTTTSSLGAIISQDVATVGGPTDVLGLGPICAINLANTVAYTQLFRNASDIPFGSNTDVVTVNMANSASVLTSLTSTPQTIDQWLINNRYTTWDSLALASFGTILTSNGSNRLDIFSRFTDFGLVSNTQTSANSTIQQVESDVFARQPNDPITATATLTTYNANTQVFTAKVPGTDHFGTITGVSPVIGNLLVKLFLGQITLQQYVEGLPVTTPTAPAGGTTVGGVYFPPVAFYFYDYDQGVRYDIYQGTTLIASSDPTAGVPTAQNLTAGEITLLEGSAAQNWFNDNPALYMKNFNNLAGGLVNYAGKILFNYNPNNGSVFTIKSRSSPSSFQWRWVMAYPINGASIGCIPATIPITQTATLTPIQATYNWTAWCGNGVTGSGSTSMIIGFTSIWNTSNVLPTTSIIPFDSTADWLH
jgi:hypothetical protein